MNSSRRQFLQKTGAAALLAATGLENNAFAQERPNILWILGEDLCPDLGCYGNKLVHTPNIDQLASEGVRFTNAFTTAPVCSAARSAFMTGMYQTSIGAHNHRSHRKDGYRLPSGVRLVTDYFRDAGYFTCNVKTIAPGHKGTAKTDFNFKVDKPFDGTDWNQRREGQPFFAQINLHEAHRKFKRAQDNPVNPDDVDIPPYYPDHPITRRDWADYLDTIGYLDKNIGVILERLKNEGLADNTVVLFMGDHGRCHVRGKQWLYDGGIHVPLIVRWPGKIRAEQVRDEMVSSIDVTATLLKTAGIEPPNSMEGQVFLGPNRDQEREYIIAARDRCDETVDCIRCVRSKDFKYIRNYLPERPYSQLNRYKECSYPVLRLMRRLNKAGKLTPAQARFMAPVRPKEELYDLRNDPHEIHNLAGDANSADTLNKMRGILDQWVKDTGDQGQTLEEPSIHEFHLKALKKNYDKRLKKLYDDERMKLEDINL